LRILACFLGVISASAHADNFTPTLDPDPPARRTPAAVPSARTATSRHLPDGLWVHEQRIRAGAAVWLFDDLPLARVDLAAAEALALTLRALLRRPPAEVTPPSRRRPPPATRMPIASSTDHPWAATLLAVARANGRVAPAARSLGVHRNTVLYRLRVAREQQGIDPRRPEDALRLLREADRPH